MRPSTSSTLTPAARSTASPALTMAPLPGEGLIYAFNVVIMLQGVDGFQSPSDVVLIKMVSVNPQEKSMVIFYLIFT